MTTMTPPAAELAAAPTVPPSPYGQTLTRLLPAMRRGFLKVNRWVAVPLLRAGLAPLFSTPLTGSLMILRTRGRRSGHWREAPLGYLIRDGAVYCCAGFGPGTLWLRNLEADPHVVVALPGRTVTGRAQRVTDPSDQVPALRALLESMPAISRPMLGDLRRTSDADVRRLAEAVPLVRIEVDGLVAGPWDPGGRGWLLSVGVSCAVAAAIAWRRRNEPRRAARLDGGPT